MANKKFYYRSKAKEAARNRRMDVQSKALENYTEQQLSMTLEDLGISDNAKQLLSANGIATAAALVVRSEKDMYKVQGLNKRILGEIKSALENNGMSLYALPEEEGESAPQEEPSQPKKNVQKAKKQAEKNAPRSAATEAAKQGAQSSKKQEKKAEGSSKFGLADRREQVKTPAVKEGKTAHADRQERLTEPLPIEVWRKVIKGGKWGFSDGFKIVIPPMYDEVFSFKEGLACVEIDGKCGFIDGENNVVIPLEYDLAMSFSEGLAMVSRGEKCGYINKQNELVIDFLYDAASPFEDGEAKVKKDGKWATLTPDGSLAWI